MTGVAPPDRHTQADAAFHDRTAHLYEQALDREFRAYADLVVFPWLERLARLTTGRDALDVGCGTGVMTIRLAERGWRVRGIDHSRGMLGIAEQKVRARGLDGRVRLDAGDVRSLPYGGARFDLVTCQGVLHHLSELGACVTEMERVLKPGGLLYIAEACHGSTPPIRFLERLAGPKPAPATDHSEGPIDAGELRALLEDLGLDPELTYWSKLPGVPRLPLWAQKPIIRGLSRPWARRSGNLVVAVARKGRQPERPS